MEKIIEWLSVTQDGAKTAREMVRRVEVDPQLSQESQVLLRNALSWLDSFIVGSDEMIKVGRSGA